MRKMNFTVCNAPFTACLVCAFIKDKWFYQKR